MLEEVSMKKYFLLSFKCLFLIALIIGCSTLQAKRAVNENTFVSSAPDLSVKVGSEFKFIGSPSETTQGPSVGGRDLRYRFESYCFVAPDKDQAKKVVAISIQTVETYYVSDWYRDIKNTLDTGTIDLRGKKYHYYTYPLQPGLNNYMVRHISQQGYAMPFGLTKVFGRVYGAKGDTLVKIYYYEALNNAEFDNKSWKNTDGLSQKQIDYLKDFNERARSAFELIS